MNVENVSPRNLPKMYSNEQTKRATDLKSFLANENSHAPHLQAFVPGIFYTASQTHMIWSIFGGTIYGTLGKQQYRLSLRKFI